MNPEPLLPLELALPLELPDSVELTLPLELAVAEEPCVPEEPLALPDEVLVDPLAWQLPATQVWPEAH